MREILLRTENNMTSAAVFERGQLCAFLQEKPDTQVQKEQIYRARITEKAKGMHAVFAMISDGRTVLVEQCDGNAGNMILIQIKRGPIGEKLPLATTELSLTGTFSVVHTRNNQVTVSKKIIEDDEVDRLKNIPIPSTFGITFRTKAFGVAIEQLQGEIAFLSNRLCQILEEGTKDGGPELLYTGTPFALKVMREFWDNATKQILVEGVELYEQVYALLPKAPVRLHTGDFPLFSLYGVETELKKAFAKNIWLKSGAYLVVEQTEAMTVIDVNSGKYSKQKDFETMADAVNREAAMEIARILRVRNMRGIIVVDFLKQENKEAQQEFLQFFHEYLRADKGKTELVDMTALGLVELTRRED